ncbi:MAG TPA: hypothetical protein VF412_07125 [Bdellovibrio sp.]|uniref:hypothetical protein n=1 Tax=Bdellovibrio sp. TaxID=28201 RepID=UPI002F09AC62
MNSEMGEFALRQIISSLVVVGPLLIIIAAFNLVFNQSKRVVMFYLVSGVVLTIVGAISLYHQFSLRGDRGYPQNEQPQAVRAAQANET